MRLMVRIGRATGAALAVSAALAASVSGGNYADVTLRAHGEAPPVAGVTHELRISLLQHGVTPVSSGDVEVIATLPSSGERLTTLATSAGGGEWTASLTFPLDGEWLIGVTHSELATPPPVPLSVSAAARGVATSASGPLGYAGIALVTATVLVALAAPVVLLKGIQRRGNVHQAG